MTEGMRARGWGRGKERESVWERERISSDEIGLQALRALMSDVRLQQWERETLFVSLPPLHFISRAEEIKIWGFALCCTLGGFLKEAVMRDGWVPFRHAHIRWAWTKWIEFHHPPGFERSLCGHYEIASSCCMWVLAPTIKKGSCFPKVYDG